MIVIPFISEKHLTVITMKKEIVLFCLTVCLLVFACSKEEKSERFELLTTPVWTTESIVATGADTTGVGVLVKMLKGDAKFNEDGTGTFGTFTGQWNFNSDETEITITTLSLPGSLVADIITLTAQSLKLSTDITLPTHQEDLINIQMSFNVK